MIWALHNPIKGWTLYDLKLEEAQAVVKTLSANEIRLLKVTRKGAASWDQFDSNLHLDLISKKGFAAEGYPTLDTTESTQTENTDFFIVKTKKVITPRLHERIECTLDVMVESSHQIFKTQTVDLSEGGLYFKDIIPDWVSGYFIVTVFFQQKPYPVMCSMVEDQKIRHRVQIVSEDSDSHYLQFKKMIQEVKAK